ncbi:electron transfer flavoprotein, alpha subunit [Halarchaeum acidiphilum MH1-52-1]|uniref:Electron transfer flavoprotein, alpha subunit n=1 Tax=Halarchaeum acidiphilum MH1-52-1 TaxID=1261545 RepID=U2YUK0_9EURY|nr:electron transfer flavoprotein subunit alpha/FixB family protein [Halarchaeum acidiphilum]GAD52695.1 electron transfer flavoprotein, alpha subunit [Halarchaeum acidiphilum MH1-52-1]
MSDGDVLAVTEHRQGELRDVSLELASAGRALADATGGDLHVAVVSGDVDAYADELSVDGVDAVHTVAAGDEFNHDVYVAAVEALVNDLAPTQLLLPNSVDGMDYAPAVAESLDRPVVTDAVEVDVTDDGLAVHREMYGSKVETVISIADGPFAVTVRPGEFEPASGTSDPEVVAHDLNLDLDALGSTVEGYEAVDTGDVDITEADFLISIGRGIEEEENLELIEDLADATGGTISASRPIVDNGWLEKGRQVGQSGKTVTPTVYLAIGISGAVQHVAGMKNADMIIAINTDPNAPIFDISDYGIVGDLFEVVPALTEQFD